MYSKVTLLMLSHTLQNFKTAFIIDHCPQQDITLQLMWCHKMQHRQLYVLNSKVQPHKTCWSQGNLSLGVPTRLVCYATLCFNTMYGLGLVMVSIVHDAICTCMCNGDFVEKENVPSIHKTQ